MRRQKPNPPRRASPQASVRNRVKQPRSDGAVAPASVRRLMSLIEEATVDCYNNDEAMAGFACIIEDRLKMPFPAKVLGVDVTVIGVDQDEGGHVVALCRRGRNTQRISILDLPLPSPPPEGSEWIKAYRVWARGG